MASRLPPLIFSTTESGDSWQRCEQSAYWGSLNGLGLERPLPGVALALGSLIHYTMADWGLLWAAYIQPPGTIQLLPTGLEIVTEQQWINKFKPDPEDIFEAHFGAFKKDVYDRYLTLNGSEMDDFEWEESYEEEVGELGRAMIANYVRFWGTPYPDDCTLIAPEQTIVRPVPKIHPRQRQLYIEGTLDQLLIDAEGMLFPRDFKTYNDAPSDYELEANDQFMSYTWLAREEWPEWQIGGFAYDGLWKRKAITSRMRKKDGSPRDDSDLFNRQYLMYSREKIDNHAAILPFRLAKIAALLRKRARYGPSALDKHRSWATCPGCSFNDACQSLLDGDFGPWDEEAERLALTDYVKRVRTPAWRVPVPDLVPAVA